MSQEKLVIERRWFQWTDLLLLPFGLIPFFFAAVGSLVLGEPNSWALLGMALVTTPLPYWSLARLVNVSKVSLTETTCKVVNGPLPWPGLCLEIGPGSNFEVGVVSSGRTGRTFGVQLRTPSAQHIIVKARGKDEAETFAARLNQAYSNLN